MVHRYLRSWTLSNMNEMVTQVNAIATRKRLEFMHAIRIECCKLDVVWT